MTFAPSIFPPPGWRPILRGDLAERALEAVREIAKDLRQLAADPQLGCEPSLARGWAGLALFFAELDSVWPGEGHDDLALDLLDRAIARTGEQDDDQNIGAGLYDGFSGVAWTLEHLKGRLFEDEDPGEETAAALSCRLGRSPWIGDYELINGLAGLGVYALERWPRTFAAECLEGVVARLAETAEARPEGIAWRKTFRQGDFNLGVSHGVPGVIPILAGACVAGIQEARPLLDGAVSWLLARKLPYGARSVFPTRVTPEGAFMPSGLAWCYGDLGIACALLVAARSVCEASWEHEALEVARAAAGRLPACEGGPADVGLCHGAAGIGHLFNRLHQQTGSLALAAAARHWLQRALDARRPGVGIGGFQAWMTGPGGVLGWWDEPGFLMGSAGIGLALLAAATPHEPAWDRVLLISKPKPSRTAQPGADPVRSIHGGKR